MLFVVVLFFLSTTASLAGEGLGPIESAYKDYNRTAEKYDSDSRLTPIKCSADVVNVCTYRLTGRLGAMVGSDKADHGKAVDFTVMMGSDSDPAYFTQTTILAIATWSPNATTEQRRGAFKTLLSALKTNSKKTAKIGTTTYRLLPLGVAGLHLIVERD